MARTVSSTLVLPRRQTKALGEVCDTRNGSGWAPAALAVNTLYDHYRGTLVCDSYKAGSARLWTDSATTHRYLVPLQGDNGDEEAIDVWVYGATAAAGSCTVYAESTNTGDFNSIAVNSTTEQWWNLGRFVISDPGASGYDEITLSITGSPTANPSIRSIVAFYARERTSLLSVVSGLAYPDGFCPHDLDACAGERVLTATRGRVMHDNLRALYQRTWPFVATSTAETTWASGSRIWLAEVPPQLEATTITATVYVYATVFDVSGTPVGSLTLQADGDAHTLPQGTNTTAWFGPLEVTVSAPAEGYGRPAFTTMKLTATGQVTAVHSVCGWWTGLSYGA